MTIFYRSPETFSSKWAVRLHQRSRRFTPYDAVLRRAHRMERQRLRDDLPTITGTWQELRRELRAHGVAQRPLDVLGVPFEATVIAADRLCAAMSLLPNDPESPSYYDVGPDDLIREPEPYLFALSAPLLDFAEHYMGLPVGYVGVSVKREIANGLCVGTRNLHRDPEDERVLKFIVYLNDVDEGTGPFQCLNAADSADVLGTRPPYRDMDDIERIIPRENWVTCLGPRLTTNIVDTARCMHRASPPVVTDRYSITFSYISERAYLAFDRDVATQVEFAQRWSALLDARQVAALTPPASGLSRLLARLPRRPSPATPTAM
jgi:hypothetical protein